MTTDPSLIQKASGSAAGGFLCPKTEKIAQKANPIRIKFPIIYDIESGFARIRGFSPVVVGQRDVLPQELAAADPKEIHGRRDAFAALLPDENRQIRPADRELAAGIHEFPRVLPFRAAADFSEQFIGEALSFL